MVFNSEYRLMRVKSIAECSKRAFCNTLEHSAILLTVIRLSFVIKIFVWSIFEWPLRTGFTVLRLFSYSTPWQVLGSKQNADYMGES